MGNHMKERRMIRFESVSKVFKTSAGQVTALSDINLTIEDGCIYGIIGLSGAGKSTLVRCMNLLERPTEGSVYLDDVNLMSLKPKELRLARRKMGMIRRIRCVQDFIRRSGLLLC